MKKSKPREEENPRDIDKELNAARDIGDSFKSQNFDLFELVRGLKQKSNLTEAQKLGLELFIFRLMTSKVVNGVAPISTGVIIDLDRVVNACVKNNLKYRVCSKFSGVPVKFREDDLKFTATFFKSGKVNVVGLQNDEPSHLQRVVGVLQKYQIDFFGFRVLASSTKRLANRVYAISIPKVLDLSNLQIFNTLSGWKNIKYNSQTFPGVRLKFENFRSKALLFKTGSIIVTGVISRHCKEQLLKELVLMLSEYLNVLNNIKR